MFSNVEQELALSKYSVTQTPHNTTNLQNNICVSLLHRSFKMYKLNFATNHLNSLFNVTTQQSVAITISFAPSGVDYIPLPPLSKKNTNNNDKKNSWETIHSSVTITISFATKPVAVKRIVSPRSRDKNSGRTISHGTTWGREGIRERRSLEHCTVKNTDFNTEAEPSR